MTFYPPPAHVKAPFILIQAEGPSVTWEVRLHDAKINSSGRYLPPMHETLRNLSVDP